MANAKQDLEAQACQRMGADALEVEELASRFAALGEEKRLAILATLGAGERCACDLTGCCGDRQPLLSFHLKRLRDAGLVRGRREGRWIHYALEREELRNLGELLIRLADGERVVTGG